MVAMDSRWRKSSESDVQIFSGGQSRNTPTGECSAKILSFNSVVVITQPFNLSIRGS
jgi:hypothetical protein